ncbi:M13 family metallopeptidase [Taibaiella soli]|uniref:M13 family peptidase n=1 Tax=Taibaiella soli TaxID=1649169 RepID=A0A2W2BCQ1_9BACT|nr:M13 family metallopeptidase [Taibaiella soli]PZF73647.1 M13 family peptidase [Taibaiella soli]
MKKSSLVLGATCLLAACHNPGEKPTLQAFADIQGLDSTVKPSDNFFRYVNGKWYDTAQIPASQSGVGTYMFMNYPQRLRLQGILDSVSKASNAAGSIEQKVGDFYASGMDTVTINRRGYDPVKPVLARIDSISNISSLMKFVADEAKLDNVSIIYFGVAPDNKNSSMNIAHVSQAGIGLPERDYYFKNDPSTVGVQEAYRNYLATLLELTGTDAAAAKKNAAIVYGIEKQLAAAHRNNVELRDVNANYNKMPLVALAKKQPNIGWLTLMDNLGAKTDSIDVSQPAYYEKLNAMLKSVSLADWKVYLKVSTLNTYVKALSKPFADADFEFSKVLSGQAVQKSRGEIIADAVDDNLGEALGQLYVKKYFTETAKKRMLELVNNLQKAFEGRINKLDWMSDSTKQKAKEKLYAITKKIGYPDKWKDYSRVKVSRDKYFENVVSASANIYQLDLDKLNKPVDKTEWFTTPSTVTAYYNPFANEIVFPAGILQAPYFDEAADDALNYGGIGMVIGHEMTHAFDDQGAQFDKNGNVTNWWTKQDYTKFNAKTKQVIDLYSSFVVLDSLHIKGAFTVGENTADNGGIAIAYDAFKLTKQGRDTARIGGFTPDQRFFISFAHIWQVKMKDEYMRLWINNNPHSTPMWRVNGPLMSLPYFYTAFNVQPGDKMYLADSARIRIW